MSPDRQQRAQTSPQPADLPVAPRFACLSAPGARKLAALFGWAVFAALIITLFSQIPARQTFDIGRNDAAVAQGLAEPEMELPGSDGVARRLTPEAALRLPQIGMPATVTLRWYAAAGTPVFVQVNNDPPTQWIASGDWVEQSVTIRSGWFKAVDVVIKISAATASDPVWLDRVTLVAMPPVVPYPAQLGYAACAGALAGALLAGRPRRQILVALAGYGGLWLLLYRISPYPLLYLPPVTVAGLAVGWLVWRWPTMSERWPRWATPWLVGAIIALWMALMWPAMQARVTLARPGVENDFRVFATRDTLETIFQADGFYNLGYPLLLWLTRPFTHDNPFLAGRLIALIGGGLLIGAGYLLARCFNSPGQALLAAIILALSGMVAQYGLLVGSDMPFAVLFTLAVAVTLRVRPDSHRMVALAAGVLAGAAFLIRHPGLLLLLWGTITLWWLVDRRTAMRFALGFALAASPQLIVNMLQTGQPLFNQQVKNVWLAVYANTDWSRWDEVPNSIGLFEVIARDPIRFLANWSRNVIGFIGAGAEDVSEFGRADQLRLLGWPANWLAIGGLALAGWQAWHGKADRRWLALVALIGLYVAVIAIAFILPRFFLPLTPIYAGAATWMVSRLWNHSRALVSTAVALIVLLAPGPAIAVNAVLAAQPAEEVAAVALVQRTLPEPGARLVAAIPERLPLAKYSAIAHLIDERVPVTVTSVELQALQADYLLWDNAQGPPPIAELDRKQIGDGRFSLYVLLPAR
ncbi:glycosyltransferase family 39 protein [Chloroflexus sp.]|uniref:glycosyltransferase family 39 protein n=1 Tax=Chloroflexus sp. TaxID=1904827 RepID=UPI00260785BE|nr:glycosyltransferase family 39 protein [uncultured Chloroflexus sp.]